MVSLDLRGHGMSEGAGEDCEIDRHVGDLVSLIDQLALERPIVVGHSMGGVIALELAVRHPELVRGIAMLDSIVAASRELYEAAQGISLLLASPRFRETITDFASRFLLRPDTDPALRERVLATMSSADPQVALAGWDSMVEYDDRGAIKACGVPILFTAAESTVAGIEELPDLNGGLELVCMSGVSHFHTLEAAAATNAHLARFVERLA